MLVVVDFLGVDFLDCVNGKWKLYKVFSRWYCVLDDGIEELGDLSDEDDVGSLVCKIVCLRCEIEEVKEEYGK